MPRHWQAVEELRGAGGGGERAGAQAPFPAVERRSGAADRIQGGRLGRAFASKLAEQRKLVEALGGLRRKFVADRIETAESTVRTFGLHGAFSRLSALDCYQAPCCLKIFRAPAFPRHDSRNFKTDRLTRYSYICQPLKSNALHLLKLTN